MKTKITRHGVLAQGVIDLILREILMSSDQPLKQIDEKDFT